MSAAQEHPFIFSNSAINSLVFNRFFFINLNL